MLYNRTLSLVLICLCFVQESEALCYITEP